MSFGHILKYDYNQNPLMLHYGLINLDQFKLISGFTMRMGDDGPVSLGDVRKEKEAQEIFDHAVSNGSGGAQSEPQTDSHTEVVFRCGSLVPNSPHSLSDSSPSFVVSRHFMFGFHDEIHVACFRVVVHFVRMRYSHAP